MTDDIYSDELAQMRNQLGLLHQKLDDQAIVNDRLVRSIVQGKVKTINRSAALIVAIALISIPYCLWVFLHLLHTSVAFAVVTILFLLIAVVYDRFTFRGFSTEDMARLPLAEIARRTVRMKRLYARWLCFSLPFLAVWTLWLAYELLVLVQVSADERKGLLIGGAIGWILGGTFGFMTYRKNQRLAREILEQVEG